MTDLRTLAEAATEGPWMYPYGGDLISGTHAEPGRVVLYTPNGQSVDLDYIAAANPKAILALLDRAEKAEAEVARLKKMIGGWLVELSGGGF